MSAKKMRVSFDIDIPVFMSMLAAGGSAMRVDLIGDDKPARKPRKAIARQSAPKLLEGPKKQRGNGARVTARDALLSFFVLHKDRELNRTELIEPVTALGMTLASAYLQLKNLRESGFVKRLSEGTFQVTARGVAHHAKTAAQAEG